mgnify:CR=1 FL=1|tara:strand:+ start:14335 stop:15408 length:1074 start_codon:yes stop_codon:yes gene_type:complete
MIKIFPGFFLCSIVAFSGYQLSNFIGQNLLDFSKSPFSPIILSILLGFTINNLISISESFTKGFDFILNIILKLGIVFLGIKLGLSEIFDVGVIGIPIIALCIMTSMLAVIFFSEKLNVPINLAILIAAGTSICGATAIVAISKSINADRVETSYAIASITIFGLIAMFLYPFFANYLFSANEIAIGLFLGTSIHETAQVAGAGLIYLQQFSSSIVLKTATATKLIRNLSMVLILPLITLVFRMKSTSKTESNISFFDLIPMFILGFLGMGFLRTIGDYTFRLNGLAFGYLSESYWESFIKIIESSGKMALTVSMAAIGLKTNFKNLSGIGLKPLFVGFVATTSVALVSILLINLSL